MGCCSFGKLKTSLVLLNLLYLLVALILIAVPAFAYTMNYFTSYALIGTVIGAGVFLFLFSFLGLCGAIHHHQVLLFFYMLVLGLLCIIQFASSVALVTINRGDQTKILRKTWETANNRTRDDVQEHMNCCGFDHNSTDQLFPPSNCSVLPCCQDLYKTNYTDCYERNVTFVNGTSVMEGCSACQPIVADQFSFAVLISGAIGLFFSFTELIGIVLAVQYRNTKDPSRGYSFPGHGGFSKN